MVYKLFITASLCTICALTAEAQLRLPAFDIGIRAGYLALNDDYNSPNGDGQGFMYQSLGVQGEINLQLGQRVAVGWFYNRAAFATNYHETWGSNTSVDLKGEHLQYGANIRISGGRAAKLRPYIQAKYFWLEVAVSRTGYRTAADMKGFGGGVGLMLRLNSKLYVNLIEGEVNLISVNNAKMFRESDLFPHFRSGLTYNFSKRK